MRSMLIEAQKRKILVRFVRPFDEGWSTIGFVYAVGPKFFMFASIDGSSMRFNGFECYRVVDARQLEVPCEHGDFFLAALRKLGERRLNKPAVNLESAEQIIRSVARLYPLINIHRENINSDVCHIGKVVQIANGQLQLLEITPHAKWEREPTVYRLNQITRIEFGGGYERALHLVGGTPKPVS